MLEAMRLSSGGASSPKGSELLALEAAVGELLRLIPVIASSAKSFTHELPFEEFLFFVSILILEPFGPIFVLLSCHPLFSTPLLPQGQAVSGLTPAALLAGYVAYAQPDVAEQVWCSPYNVNRS